MRLAREGVVISEQIGFVFDLLEPILRMTPESEALYAPNGRILRGGERFRSPDVANLLAFSDPSAFVRAFRRWTGMTPGQWRRAQRAPDPEVAAPSA